MKTVREANDWWDKLENEGAIYVWGMNGETITDESIEKTYKNYKSATYNRDYYNNKLKSGKGKIGADCSGAFMPIAGGDNTAAGYYVGCKTKGVIGSIPKDTPCMVFKKNSSGNIYHIGWYRPENQTVSEMASSSANFRRKPLLGGRWDLWGIPTFIDYTNGQKKSGWRKESGAMRFYLGDTGQMVRNDWYQDDGKWYWFDGSGKMVAKTWYLYKDSWYYLGEDGAMCIGKQTVDGKWYCMDEEGRMITEPVILVPDENGALEFSGLAK